MTEEEKKEEKIRLKDKTYLQWIGKP